MLQATGTAGEELKILKKSKLKTHLFSVVFSNLFYVLCYGFIMYLFINIIIIIYVILLFYQHAIVVHYYLF